MKKASLRVTLMNTLGFHFGSDTVCDYVKKSLHNACDRSHRGDGLLIISRIRPQSLDAVRAYSYNKCQAIHSNGYIFVQT